MLYTLTSSLPQYFLLLGFTDIIVKISLSTGGDRVLEEPGCQADLVGRADQLSAVQDDPGHPQGGQLQATQGSQLFHQI